MVHTDILIETRDSMMASTGILLFFSCRVETLVLNGIFELSLIFTSSVRYDKHCVTQKYTV